MARFAYITTPIPTLDEVGKSLKIGKARQQRIIAIVKNGSTVKFQPGHRIELGTANARLRDRDSSRKLSGSRTAKNVSAQSKKSKRVAAS
jgi:hypothetical protein